MVGGQVLDLAAEAVPSGRVEVEEIHARKTAALFGSAAEMGAIAARAGFPARTLARRYGLSLGRCFQATDDILDETGTAKTLGKTPGKDRREEKPTLVAAIGLDPARAEARRLADEARAAALDLPAKEGDLAFRIVDRILTRTS
jgi:farnesyl diphosphate synthase